MKNGQIKLDWINEQIKAGKKVYFATAYKITKISAKTLKAVTVGKDGGIYINGVCFDYARLTAE